MPECFKQSLHQRSAFSTVPLPEGEMLRRAVRWISEQRELGTNTKRPLAELIDEAGKTFDLSPKDCEFLIHFFTEPHARED